MAFIRGLAYFLNESLERVKPQNNYREIHSRFHYESISDKAIPIFKSFTKAQSSLPIFTVLPPKKAIITRIHIPVEEVRTLVSTT